MRLFRLDVFRIQNFDVADLVSSVCCHLACSGSYNSGVTVSYTHLDVYKRQAIVRATHNEYMLRLLPLIHQAVATAVEAGEQQERLAADTLRDHALLLEFFRRRDGAGAEHAMACLLYTSRCV